MYSKFIFSLIGSFFIVNILINNCVAAEFQFPLFGIGGGAETESSDSIKFCQDGNQDSDLFKGDVYLSPDPPVSV
jgi:hypothetical protein